MGKNKSRAKKSTENERQRRTGKGKDTTNNETTPEETKRMVINAMNSIGCDGDFFARNLEIGVQDRLKRAKPPRRIRWLHYCTWAHALMRKEIGPENSEFAFPTEVLTFIRALAPGNIKGEIREDAYAVSMEDFCSALDLPRLDSN